MKKRFTFFMLACILSMMSISAQTWVIKEGFEQGIPSDWTQINVGDTTAKVLWQVEGPDDLQYPNNVYSGSKRVALRNTTGQTVGYKVQLILPKMDLSTLYQPILKFAYANPKWTADFDTLTVYYKTAEKEDWKLLKSFTTASAKWQKVSVDLPSYGKTYFLAFEGTDNMGRGIVLDSVEVRSAPECTVPHDLYTTGLAAGKITLGWQASFDAESFDVMVFKRPVPADSIEILADSTDLATKLSVSGLKQQAEVSLAPKQTYYFYVRSVCETETSSWSEAGSFYMKPMKAIPFVDNMNRGLRSTPMQDNEWSWGTNLDVMAPFFATHLIGVAQFAPYSMDSTVHIAFTGGAGASKTSISTTALPANKYAYACTPELYFEGADTASNLSMKDLQVSFEATVASYNSALYAHKIKVGVMTDPEDISTFQEIETCEVTGYKEFNEFVVSMDTYQGTGMFVAFVSDFDTQNLFYIDNVVVEKRTGAAKPGNIQVHPQDTIATVTWKGKAPAYNIVVATVNTKNVDELTKETGLVYKQMGVVGNQCVVQNLTKDLPVNKPYYVYLQGVKGDEKSKWTMPKKFWTVDSPKAFPITYMMEMGATEKKGSITYSQPVGMGVFSSYSMDGSNIPYLTTSEYKEGASSLYISKSKGHSMWITLATIADTIDISQTQILFYAYKYSSSYDFNLSIGVMDNPMDIKTFVPVSTFKASQGATWERCYATFESYTGTGKTIAIRIDDPIDNSTCLGYIDNLIIEKISECKIPAKVQTSVQSTSATLTWDNSDAQGWQILVSTKALTENQLLNPQNISSSILVANDSILAPTNALTGITYTLNNLEIAKTYHYRIRTFCSNDTSLWSNDASFKTVCPDMYKVPFFEGFENYESGEEVGCWDRSQSTNGYGVVTSSTTHSGSKAFQLESDYGYYNYNEFQSILVTPKLDADIKDLRVTFYARAYDTYEYDYDYDFGIYDYFYYDNILLFGTITDPADTTTFHVIDTINLTTSYQRYSYDMSDYTGTDEYFAFYTGNGVFNDIYIDDISVQPFMCARPEFIIAKDIKQDKANIHWSGHTTDKFEIKVLTTKVEPIDILLQAVADSLVVLDTVAKNNAFQVSGLTPLTTYYVYVRPTCGDSLWGDGSFVTACVAMDPAVYNLEDFEACPAGTTYNDAYHPQCWTWGNPGRDLSSSSSASDNYYPFVYEDASKANSGTKSMRIRWDADYDCSPAWICSPELLVDDLANVGVTFYAKISTGKALIVGVMSNPEDYSTFVALDSIIGTDDYEKIRVDLSDYETLLGDAKHFAIRSQINSYSTAYVDDVQFFLSMCKRPKGIISNMTDSSVVITSGLRENAQWRLLLTDKYVDADSLKVWGNQVLDTTINVLLDTVLASNVKALRLDDLTGDTDYFCALQTLCDAATVSDWKTIDFHTPCAPMTIEALGVVGFETEEGYATGSNVHCWTIGTISDNETYMPTIKSSSYSAHSGDQYLYMRSYMSTSTKADGYYAIMPTLDLQGTSITELQVSFWGKGYTSSYSSYKSSIIVGIVTDPSDISTFVAVDTIYNDGSKYGYYSVPFDKYQGDFMGMMGQHIAFYSNFGMSNEFSIDDIVVEPIPPCPTPNTITIDTIIGASVEFHWDGIADNYRVAVSTEELTTSEEKENATYLINDTVSTNSYTISKGLEYNKTYYIYVKALCSDTLTSEFTYNDCVFSTSCPDATALPIFETFEDAASTRKIPSCWYVVKAGSYPYVQLSYGVDNSASVELYIYSSSTSNYCALITPAVDLPSLSQAMLSLYARSYSSSYSKANLVIGVVDDPNDFTTFVPLDTVLVTGKTPKQYEIMFDQFASQIGTQKHIVMCLDKSNATADLCLDNIKITKIPTCFPPTNVQLIGTPELTSAVVKLTPYNETSTTIELAVLSGAQVQKMESYNALDTLGMHVTVTDTMPFTITGLQPSTQYHVYARTNCGAGDYSEWTMQPLCSFLTQFYYGCSYEFGFEKTDAYVPHPKSTSELYYIHPALQIDVLTDSKPSSYSYYPYCRVNTTSYAYSLDGDGALLLPSTTSKYQPYVVLPATDCNTERSLQMDVRAGYENIYSTYSKTTSCPSNPSFLLGTIDKNAGIETLELLGRVPLVFHPTSDTIKVENNKLYEHFIFDLDAQIVQNKQIVIINDLDVTGTLTVDNIKMGESLGYGYVFIDSCIVEENSVSLYWKNMGGPWNIYAISGNDTIKATNLTTNSYTFTGLKPASVYDIQLSSTAAPADTKGIISSVQVMTDCVPLELNEQASITWTFDESLVVAPYLSKEEDAALYLLPICWNAETTHATASDGYQFLVQRPGYDYYPAPSKGTTYDHYEYGMDNSYSLRIYAGTSTRYNTPYAVLPALNCDLDTMLIEFYMRPISHYADTYGTASSRGKVLGSSYAGNSIVVGTMSDPNDFATFVEIATAEYQEVLTSSTYVTSDPQGLDYWRKYKFKLSEDNGKYIAFAQPGGGVIYIDNVTVRANHDLFAPSDLMTKNVSSTTADLTWEAGSLNCPTVVVLTQGNNVIIKDTVTEGNTYHVIGLDANEEYSWYAYHYNDETQSDQSSYANFRTLCSSIDLPESGELFYNFDNPADFVRAPYANIEANIKDTVFYLPSCWGAGTTSSQKVSSNNFSIQRSGFSSETGEKDYDADELASGRNKSNALRVYVSYQSNATPYVVLPELDCDLDTMMIEFWGRTFETYKSYYSDYIDTYYEGDIYSVSNLKSSILVGTMTDPNDFSTFVCADSIVYPYTNLKLTNNEEDDATGNNYWVKFKAQFANSGGKYIAFAMSTKGMFFIDDVTIKPNKIIFPPSNLRTDSISANAATLTWKNAKQGANTVLVLQSGASTIMRDTLAPAVDTYQLTDLLPNSQYSWYLYHIYTSGTDAIDGEKSQESSFKTPCVAIDLDANNQVVWTFDENLMVAPYVTTPSDAELYFIPECWNVANTSTTVSNGYQFLVQRTGYDYWPAPSKSSTYDYHIYGINGSNSLRIYTSTSASYKTSYAVLPLINCDLDTMLIEFYGRNFAHYGEGYSNVSKIGKPVSTYYFGKGVVVGTMSDPNDFNTFVALDTCYYEQNITSSTLVDEDPAGLQYWKKYRVALENAQGDYIAFVEPFDNVFFIDNVTLKPNHELFPPKDLKCDEVTGTTANLSWTKTLSTNSVQITLMQGENVVLCDTVTTSTYTLNNLNPSTHYIWSLIEFNEEQQSDPITSEFTTECAAVDLSQLYTGFEESEGVELIYTSSYSHYTRNLCWTYGDHYSPSWSSSYSATNISNEDAASSAWYFAKTGDYAARLYAGYSVSMGEYSYQNFIATPEVQSIAAYDSLQIHFWMRPTYSYEDGHMSATSTSATYSVIVGTCDDVDDFTTFMPIDTVDYEGSYTSSDYATASNNYLFQEVEVPLRGAQGKHVYLMATAVDSKGNANSSCQFYIDDISFDKASLCTRPKNVKVIPGVQDATIMWTGAAICNEYLVEVSTDAMFTNSENILRATVTTTQARIQGLQKQTTYYARVMSSCAAEFGTSAWTQPVAFNTVKAPFYLEDFVKIDNDWDHSTVCAEHLFNDSLGNVQMNSSEIPKGYGWTVTNDTYGINDRHVWTPFNTYTSSSTAYRYEWLLTPALALESDKKVVLSFDLAQTQSSEGNSGGSWMNVPSELAATEKEVAKDFVFLVAISTDGGVTWKREDAQVWCQDENGVYGKPEHKLLDITNVAQNVRIDLSKYAGTSIKVGFYREAYTYKGSSSPTIALHLDNVRFNYYTEIVDMQSACQYEDVEFESGYIFNGDNVQEGLNEYKTYQIVANEDAQAGVVDTAYVYQAYYTLASITTFETELCHGEIYADNGFRAHAKSGTYKQKMLSQVTGCDSIVELRLTVLPQMGANLADTICQGDTYTFFGQQIQKTGIYRDTLISSTGCDSVVTLALQVVAPQYTYLSKTICEGSTYEFMGQVLSKAGIYTDTLTSVTTGCDSIIELNLELSTHYQDTIVAHTCGEQTYSFYDQTYDKTGKYIVNVEGQAGDCDTVFVLDLTVHAIDTIYVDTVITVDQLPYQYENIIYPEGSETGTYKQTIEVNTEYCHNVVVHTLTINPSTDIEQIKLSEIDDVYKIVYKEHIYIVRNNQWYDVTGKQVECPIKDEIE